MLSDTLRRYLDDLEARIDPQQEETLIQQWIDFSEGRFESAFFSPSRATPRPPALDWPTVRINEALDSHERMALQQYGACSAVLATGHGSALNVRSNYGSSIMPLLFGVKPFIMDDEFDTLPTSEPLNDIGAIEDLLAAGVPDIHAGFGAKVFEMGLRYQAIAQAYPKIGQYVYIYHPDTQGAMDICEVIWGSTMFYAMYDRPELVHALLELVTETYVKFLQAWFELAPPHQGYNAHWGFMHKGNIMLRDDSAMNLSADMFDAFIKPYDQRCLDEFGGGAVHFCGKGDHYMPRLTQMRGMYAIHMSQPHYNDMEAMYAATIDKGVNILGLQRPVAKESIASGRDLRGRVQAY